MLRPFLCLPFIIFIAGCTTTGSNPPPVQADSVTMNWYADWLVLDHAAKLSSADSTARAHSIDSLSKAYHTTPAEMLGRVAAIQKNPRQWKEFYSGVLRRLEWLQQNESPPPQQGMR